MQFVQLISLLPLVAAIPAPAQDQSIKTVSLSYYKDFKTGADSFWISDKAKKQFYGHSCSNELKIGGLKFDLRLNQYAQGNVTIGSKVYVLHEDPAYSGGIVCTAVYDNHEAHVDCDDIPWTAGSMPTALPAKPSSTCLKDHLVRRASFGIDAEYVDERSLNSGVLNDLGKRQAGGGGGGTCGWNHYVTKVGDGNPHQNFRHTQISVSKAPLLPETLLILMPDFPLLWCGLFLYDWPDRDNFLHHRISGKCWRTVHHWWFRCLQNHGNGNRTGVWRDKGSINCHSLQDGNDGLHC
jgi:hypothetical protein